jgi:hypothetical protein
MAITQPYATTQYPKLFRSDDDLFEGLIDFFNRLPAVVRHGVGRLGRPINIAAALDVSCGSDPKLRLGSLSASYDRICWSQDNL